MKRSVFLMVTIFCLNSIVTALASGADTKTTVIPYSYPRITPRCSDFRFKANGTEIELYDTSAGPFAAFSCDGPVQIEIELPAGTSKNLHISPLKNGIKTERENNSVRFEIPGPMLLAVMVELMPVLYIYANPLENNKPDPEDTDILYFKAGQVYEAGDLELRSNQTLYIEGGAVLRGAVRAVSAENVRIAGYGILDGSYFTAQNRRRSILFEDCRNSIIEDIIMIEPTSWMIVLGLSDSIRVNNVKQLGTISTSDGVDVVGSRHIRIANSFLRNGDDCVAVKSFDLSKYERSASFDYSRDVYDVEVSGCILISFLGGHAFEIGHELTTDSVRDIRFIDNDVLGIHGKGGVFGINNTDRALVSNILYENIRVEHYYNKLINFRVIKSRYAQDDKRGRIRNVKFHNIDVTNSQYNPGYSVSLIGGYNKNHTVEDIIFENFRVNGRKISCGDEIYLFTAHARRIVFR